MFWFSYFSDVNIKFLKIVALGVLVCCYQFAFAQQTNVLINEIYFDVKSSNGLPEAEYVELFNNSASTINLNGWSFKNSGSPKIIEEDFLLVPNGYVLLTKQDNIAALQSYGNIIGFSSFPQLVNAGDDLALCNPQGEIVHEVFYKTSWLNDLDKDDGGWALELIDPDNFCGLGLKENWTASTNPIGGTPGALNSVDGSTKDDIAPAVKAITVLSSNAIKIQFTEPVELPEISNIDNYKLSGDETNFSITNIFICNDDNSCVEIEINENFEDNILYNLVISNLFDCTGNEISSETQNFVKPGLIAVFDIVINEILYDPLTDEAAYIELYNNSDKLFDLNNLNVQDLKDTVNIVTNKNLLQPKGYALLTEDTLSIINTYFADFLIKEANLVEVESLPSLNNDADVIRLSNADFSIIDSVYYNEDWHFSLLGNHTDGVALERISFTGPSQDANNWQSASKAVNYGTPGYKNSQTNEASGQSFNEIINIENKTVSPDNDGFEDFLLINYQTKEGGEAANVYIYSEIGQLVAHPIKNELLGKSGTFKWDGLDESGARIPLGIYIVYAEFFNLNGSLSKQKIPVIVAGRL